MPGGAGELGELHPLSLRRRLRPPPRQDWNPSLAPGGDLQNRKGNRIGELNFQSPTLDHSAVVMRGVIHVFAHTNEMVQTNIDMFGKYRKTIFFRCLVP